MAAAVRRPISTGPWHVLPATSTSTPVPATPSRLVLPARSPGLAIAPDIMRMVRAAMIEAVSSRDLPVIQALGLFIAAFYIVVNLIADGPTALATPRARQPAVAA